MRTESPSPVGSAVAQIRAEYARARRRIADRTPAWARPLGRWGLTALAVIAFGLLAVAVVWNGLERRSATSAYVLSGEPLSPDDLIRVRRALETKHVPYRVDARNRVEVAASRLTEANDALVKLDVGPRPLDDRERRSLEASPFESPLVRERREEQARSDQIAEMIRRLDPSTIASARVEINRPRPRLGQRGAPAATAFVYLDTLDDREVNPLLVQSIVGMVAGFAPEVRSDSVSLWDHKGRHYADARDPTLAATARARARAWELGQEIRDKLEWIKGARVSVHLAASEPAPADDRPTTLPTPSPLPPPLSLPPLPDDPPPAPPAEEVRLATPIIGVNQPLDLEPTAAEPAPISQPELEPEPEPEVRPEPARAEAPRVAQVPTNPSPIPSGSPPKVQVWVKIPRSYYLKALQSREPSLDDLQALVSRTESLVTTAVEHVVPPDERGEVKVNTIPDDWPAPAPPLSASSDAMPPWSWWVPALAGALVAALAIGLGARVLGPRKSALRPTSRADRGRFKIDEATDRAAGTGPSDRVRELIRANPEAAASVLLRWTGQGGPAT